MPTRLPSFVLPRYHPFSSPVITSVSPALKLSSSAPCASKSYSASQCASISFKASEPPGPPPADGGPPPPLAGGAAGGEKTENTQEGNARLGEIRDTTSNDKHDAATTVA